MSFYLDRDLHFQITTELKTRNQTLPHHPITLTRLQWEESSLRAEVRISPQPVIPPYGARSASLAHSGTGSAADSALSDWDQSVRSTRPLNLFMHNCVCFSSDVKNVLVKHKALLPSLFAQIGFFCVCV